MANDLYMIAYVSKLNPKYNNEDSYVQSIETSSKKNNPKHDITGVLFFHKDLFLQVLEGPHRNLVRLIDHISKDERHMDIAIIAEDPITERGLADWNMDCFNLSNNTYLNKNKLVEIAKEYKKILVPRGDTFAKFYKAIIEQSA